MFSADRISARLLAIAITTSRRGLRFDVFVHPTLRIVLPGVLLPAAEEPFQIFGVAEVVIDNRGRIGVIDNVLLEIPFIVDDVADYRAQKSNVGTRTDGHVKIGYSTGTS